MKVKWCVTLSGQGWGWVLHPSDGTETEADTDTYDSFAEAKRECLQRHREFLKEVRDRIAEIKRIKKAQGGEGPK